MLEIRDLDLFYGDAQALDGVSLEIAEGEIVALVGANGAGKTSLIRTVAGMLRPERGSIRFAGAEIARLPSNRICRLGIGQVAEGRQIFPTMTVMENLELGAASRPTQDGLQQDLERAYGLFPRLAERRRQLAGTLSGGEQQMLAIARCLMARPRLVMLDEPSLGLAPLVAADVFAVIRRLNEEEGMTILLSEQNVALSLALAARGYVIETGRIVLGGSGTALLADARVREAYIGVGRR